VRLGAWAPFGRAAGLLAHFPGTRVSEATAPRATERAGEAWLRVQAAATERIEGGAAAPGDGAVRAPDTLEVSADGALVCLVGGEWAEVKLATVGEVGIAADGTAATSALSYFARLTDADTFGREALVECERRGVSRAAAVVAVADGAPRSQGFFDLHCPEAVRILDFPHALGYLARAAQEAFGPGTEATSAWIGAQAPALKHGDPDQVLADLATLPATAAREDAPRYLTERRALIAYAAFRAAGYPIGSGCVESGNKVVIEERLKGAGMRWRRDHANAMAARRTVVDNDRWGEAWPQIAGQLRAQARLAATARRRARLAHHPAPPRLAVTPSPPPLPDDEDRGGASAAIPPAPPPKRVVNGRPTSAHPWKRRLLLRPHPPAPLPPKL
jgi:hypothetical protein